MSKQPDDRIVIWEDNLGSQFKENSKVYNATILSKDDKSGVKCEKLMNRSGFLAWLSILLSLLGLSGCAFYLADRNVVRRHRYQYCKCVPVCVCDLVCTCDLVDGLQQNTSKTEEEFTTKADPRHICKCVPVCTCDLVCTCDTEGTDFCQCNPYWYPN